MLNLKPHKMEVDPLTKIERCARFDPYIRLTQATPYENAAGKVCYKNIQTIFLQNGKIYDEGSNEYSKVPDWALEEIKKISEKQLLQVGFGKAPPKHNPQEIDASYTPKVPLDWNKGRIRKIRKRGFARAIAASLTDNPREADSPQDGGMEIT